MTRTLRYLSTLAASTLFSASVMAVPIMADLDAVTGDLTGGYTIDVAGLGSLSLTYATPTTSYDGYSDTSTFFAAGGSNFVLGAGNSLTISGVGFDLGSAIFDIWDLDTVNALETVSFTGGSMLTGVNYNIANSTASTTDVQQSGVIVAQNGAISVMAGPEGAAFGIGAIGVTAAEPKPVPAPATLALLAAGLVVMRRFISSKNAQR